MVIGPIERLYIRSEGTPALGQETVDVWVEDEEGNELFRTNKGADVAIQWAIDHQSSGESADK